MPAPNANFPISGSQKVSSVWPSLHALLDEGSLYIASTTDAASGKAAGTGIATTTSVVDDAATASATHAQNVPVLYWANPQQQGVGSTYYPLSIHMIVTAAQTSATVWNYALRLDNSNRLTTAGTVLASKNLNVAAPNQASSALIQVGAPVTALASGAQRVVGSGQVQSSIAVAKDVWIFTFGDNVMPSSILTASAAKNINIPCAPFCIPPGWNLTFEMWGASCAGAPAWEWEIVFADRAPGL